MMKKHIFLLMLLSLSAIPLYAQWVQIGSDINGEAVNDLSGSSIALNSDGSILAIGATRNEENGTFSGHVRVYLDQNGNWTQIGDDIDSEHTNDAFGFSVRLNSDGTILAVGATGNDGNGTDSGHVRIFQNLNGNWLQIGNDIDGEAAFERSGYSISLSSDGSVIAIGAIGNNDQGMNAGQVRIYENNNGNWIQIGDDINGEAAGDSFGITVSLSSDGSIVAIGGQGNDGNGTDSGHARVYGNQNGTWVQIGNDIDGEAADDFFSTVSLNSDGSILAIGGQGNDGNGLASGHVRIFQNVNGTWSQMGNAINGEAMFDNSGRREEVSLNADGSIVAIGATVNDGNGSNSGHVRVYQFENGLWIQVGMDIDGEAEGDFFGDAVRLSSDGSVLAVGAPFNDGNGSDSGHVRVFKNNSLLSVADYKSTNISIYPNPTNGKLFIKGDHIQKIEVINIHGRHIYTLGQRNEIDLSRIEKGVYILRVHTEKGIDISKVILN